MCVKADEADEKEEKKEEEENEEIIITYQSNRKESEIKEVEITEDSLKIVFIDNCDDRISECSTAAVNDDNESVCDSEHVKIHICIPYRQRKPYIHRVKEKVGLFIRCVCRATAKIKNTPFGNFLCTCFCACNNAGDTTDSESNPNAPAVDAAAL